MYGTILAIVGAAFALASWWLSGWAAFAAAMLGAFCATFGYFYYFGETKNNTAMFFGCLIAWLSAIIQIFLWLYV